MFVWEFAFCLFISYAYKCTWIGRLMKETVLWSKAEYKRTQHCRILHVGSVCTPCCMLLDFVAQSLKSVKLFSQQLPTLLLIRDRRSIAQQCWTRSFLGPRTLLRMDYKDLWVVFFPRCTAGPNIVGSCCIRLQTTANTRATTPNIVGATMLGLVGQQKCARLHGAKSLTGFKLCPTTRNNIQQNAIGCANGRNM